MRDAGRRRSKEQIVRPFRRAQLVAHEKVRPGGADSRRGLLQEQPGAGRTGRREEDTDHRTQLRASNHRSEHNSSDVAFLEEVSVRSQTGFFADVGNGVRLLRGEHLAEVWLEEVDIGDRLPGGRGVHGSCLEKRLCRDRRRHPKADFPGCQVSLERFGPRVQSFGERYSLHEWFPDLGLEVRGGEAPSCRVFRLHAVREVEGHSVHESAFAIRGELPEQPFVIAVGAAKARFEAIPCFPGTAVTQAGLKGRKIVTVEECREGLPLKTLGRVTQKLRTRLRSRGELGHRFQRRKPGPALRRKNLPMQREGCVPAKTTGGRRGRCIV